MRLTTKEKTPRGNIIYDFLDYYPLNDMVIAEKLGKLEDIEDKFNMSLLDMFKILMEGAYVMCDHKPIYVLPSRLCMTHTDETGYCIITDWGEPLHPDKYGKVWAFTAEELQNNEELQSNHYCDNDNDALTI